MRFLSIIVDRITLFEFVGLPVMIKNTRAFQDVNPVIPLYFEWFDIRAGFALKIVYADITGYESKGKNNFDIVILPMNFLLVVYIKLIKAIFVFLYEIVDRFAKNGGYFRKNVYRRRFGAGFDSLNGCRTGTDQPGKIFNRQSLDFAFLSDFFTDIF